MSESYISQLYYLVQVHQDMKAFLFTFAGGGVKSVENKLQNVMNQNNEEFPSGGKFIKVAKV